ncbi:protein-ADP-ribose hydrolase [Ruegeria atlantica]|uniref:protein-ADP-ribose hydrolase n=1 Tax=Ruegeria atlantica TaxID=81569 RepID=UPI002494D9AF|nr:protein-ADP-ribose hydrolase [Ruegeria atlantica]
MLQYADLIKLRVPFVPATGAADLTGAVSAIKADPASREFCSRHHVPYSPADQRRWVQAALTMRATGALSDELTNSVDRLLQSELAQKNIVDAASLPRAAGPHSFGEMISIWDGDITTLKIDAITNAANAQMLGCFQPFHACIDNAIQCAAGPQLREDCAMIMSQQGRDERTSEAKITRGYNLPSKFVLHTVGPIVPIHRPTAEQAQQLASCYTSCLSLAARAGVKSLAFCAISTGVFGYPPEEAADVALRTVSDWLQAHQGHFEHVVFNTFGDAATEIYERKFASWM